MKLYAFDVNMSLYNKEHVHIICMWNTMPVLLHTDTVPHLRTTLTRQWLGKPGEREGEGKKILVFFQCDMIYKNGRLTLTA